MTDKNGVKLPDFSYQYSKVCAKDDFKSGLVKYTSWEKKKKERNKETDGDTL